MRPPVFWQEFAIALFIGLVSAIFWFIAIAFVVLVLLLWGLLVNFHT